MILKLRFSFVFNILLIFLYFTHVKSVPEDYCLSHLNTSDCGRPPTPVFYYYKPGSRCEVKLWRGCPTENLFNTEYHCSHHCIGKLWSSEQNVKSETISKTLIVDSMKGLKYRCDTPIDISQCKQAKQFVYTYDKKQKKCIEVTYYGCPTENKFRDEEECQDICEKSENPWERAINNMNLDELNKINVLLDNVKDEIEDLKKVSNSQIRPHTVSDVDEVIDLPGDETSKVDNESKESSEIPDKPIEKPEEPTDQPEAPTDKPEAPTDNPEAPTDKPEVPTDKPEAPTDKPEETTIGKESQTEAETPAAVATTNSAQENTAAPEGTTKLPVSTKRTRKRRRTQKPKEGDVVRKGVK